MSTQLISALGEACAGSWGVVLLREDGKVVEQVFAAPSTTVAGLGPQLTGVLAEVRRTAAVLEYGQVAEIAVSTDRLTLLVRAVGLRHYLALILAPDGNVGRGRFLLRTFASRLAAVLG